VCGNLAFIASPHYWAVDFVVSGIGFPSICGTVIVFVVFSAVDMLLAFYPTKKNLDANSQISKDDCYSSLAPFCNS